VLDSLGAKLDITDPDDGCFEVGTVEVTGSARGIAFVDVHLNGELAETVAVEGSSWSAQVSLPGPGEYEVRAEGRDEHGELVALATNAITYGDDQDGDGVTACGGDCNDLDPSASPDQGEVCGDGIDQDCDGVDLVCDVDDPAGDETSTDDGCNCSSEPDRRGVGFVPLGVVILLAWRRRRA
jgi:MYXO-CTERM domain-containing protein